MTIHFKPLTLLLDFEVVGRRNRSFNYCVPQTWQRESVLSKRDFDIETDKQLLQKSRYGRFNIILHRILNAGCENCHSQGNYNRVSIKIKIILNYSVIVYWQDICVCLVRYLVQNPQNWYPNPLLLVNAIENVNKLNMNLIVTHTINFQDFAEKNVRRTELVIAVKRLLEELEIDYTLLPQDVHLIGHKWSFPCFLFRV